MFRKNVNPKFEEAWHLRINFLHVYFCHEVKLINSSLKIEAFNSRWKFEAQKSRLLNNSVPLFKIKGKITWTWKTWCVRNILK